MVHAKSLWGILLPAIPIDGTRQEMRGIFLSPRLHLLVSPCRIDPDILVVEECIGAHSHHEGKGRAHDDNQRISAGVGQPVFLERFLCL